MPEKGESGFDWGVFGKTSPGKMTFKQRLETNQSKVLQVPGERVYRAREAKFMR